MKSVSQKSVSVFMRLTELINADGCLKIRCAGFMDLNMERLLTDIRTPMGPATIYCLAHYFVQEGDLMSDPEMEFICVDLRNPNNQDLSLVSIYPLSYTLSSLSIYQEAISLATGNYRPSIYKSLLEFTDIWLKNILEQGFLSDDAIVVSV